MDALEPLKVESNRANLEDLDHLWRPFMKISRAVGVFPFVLKYGDGPFPWWRNLWNLCSVFALCCFCGRVGFTVASRVAGGWSVTLLDVDFLSVVVFPLHLMASTASFVYFLNFTSYLSGMCHLWSSLTFGQDIAARIAVQVKRKMKWALALCAVAMLQAVHVLGTEIYNFHKGDLPIARVLSEVPNAWCVIVHVIQTGLFCSLCCAIICLLNGLCQDMEAKVAKENTGIHLKLFKGMYITVIDFIQVSNQLFGIYAGFLITSSLLQACFDTYTLVVYTNIHKNVFDVWLWVVYNLLITVVVCLSAGKISDQARRPYRILLKIDLSKCSSFQQNEALMLLDCVKNLDANISMFRIMPITMQTFPTIISIYFSYMVLLFSFPTGSAMATNSAEAKNDSITQI